jgi:hypothetical protein
MSGATEQRADAGLEIRLERAGAGGSPCHLLLNTTSSSAPSAMAPALRMIGT